MTILQGVQLDAGSGAEPAFALVTGDPSSGFNQEPYALIYPATTTDTKGAYGQNDRTVNFAVLILLEMENGTRTQDATYFFSLNHLPVRLN